MDIRETVAASLAATTLSEQQRRLAGQLARQAGGQLATAPLHWLMTSKMQ